MRAACAVDGRPDETPTSMRVQSAPLVLLL